MGNMAEIKQVFFLQYVDKFFARMELLKRESTDWDTEDYEIGMVHKLSWALGARADMVAAERSLRDALTARSLDTQLSQGVLQTLKVRIA